MAKEVHSKQPNIRFHAVSCVAHNKLCKTQKVDGYPTVMFFKEGSYIPEESENFNRLNANTILSKLGFDENGKQTTVGKVQSIRVKAPRERKVVHLKTKEEKEKLRAKSQNKSEPTEEKPVEQKPDEHARVVPFHVREVSDAWHDAATSFEFSLKYNLYMSNGPMPKKDQDALLDWLELLADTLPPQMDRTNSLVKHLIGKLHR